MEKRPSLGGADSMCYRASRGLGVKVNLNNLKSNLTFVAGRKVNADG